MSASPPRIAIIGGGYAGFACAVELARAGVMVSVFERSHTLGGRARVVARDGWRVDNGQHILLGAYTELSRLLRLVGVPPKQLERLPLTLNYPGRLHLQAADLPAPFHLLLGFLRARGLSFADRLAAVRLMRGLKKQQYQIVPDCTVAALLARTRQTATLKNLIWEPLCVAALNTPAEYASAQIFANVLRDSLGADAAASELLIPRTDLSELFPVPAARYLATRRGVVRTTTAIEGIQTSPGGFRLVGDPVLQEYAQVVIATAPYHAGALLASLGEGTARLVEQIEALDYEPILTVYLAFDPPLSLPAAMIGLREGPGQWAFDRGRCGGRKGLIAVVISAHGAHEEMPRDLLEVAIQRQLEETLGCRLPSPRWTQSISERRATFACRPGLQRPILRTPVPGLWLAGDYLDEAYPATLESAARAGRSAAREVLRTLEAPPLETQASSPR